MSNDLYRAFWRIHFYAGLIVLPFLAWLAITGGLYLFKPELDHLVYRDWIELGQPRQPERMATLIPGVERQTGGRVTQIERPAGANQSWRMRIETEGLARTAFVDPGDGRVLGTSREGGTMKIVRDLHSLVITGTFGNALIEIAAGWAIILVVTGFVLWWPRNGEPALALRGPPKSRRFWRDLHASTGAIAGAIILFLAVTGMPWSIFWGAQLQQIVAANGLGRPKAPGPLPWEHKNHEAAEARRETLPWAMQAAQSPRGSAHGYIGPDKALAIAEAAGLVAPYTISLPAAPSQPFTVSKVAVRADDAHAVYIDAGTGKVLQDARYGDFGTGARVIEWGIATHQGQEYGPANRWIMLAGCVAILLLVITAPILWWKRRLRGALALPPAPASAERGHTATLVALALAVIYPLTGLTVVVVLLLDKAILRGSAAAR